EAERRKIPIDFPFFLAVTTAAQALWQFGFSSTGPLLSATSGHFLQNITGIMPLSTTIWSPAAIIHQIAYTCAALVSACVLMPKTCRPISEFPESGKLVEPTQAAAPEDDGIIGFAQHLEKSAIVPLILCTMLGIWIGYHFLV